jgi:HPt (histidine-containing phosphotransfer) domain-containing protein
MRTTPGSIDTSNIVDVCRADRGVDLILLREMLGYFVDENRRRMQQAAVAAAAGDREALRQLAHAVRGSASMIGAGHLHDLATALERDAEEAHADALNSAVSAMSAEFLAVHQALRAMHPEAVS